MTVVIKDGKTGQTAKVDNQNRLTTFAVTHTNATESSIDGDLYNINAGIITLTSANVSSLLFLKNTDLVNWVVSRVFYNIDASTGGSGSLLADVVANATAGTLISAGTDFTAFNLNFGSAEVLTAILKKGAEGSTLTDGEVRVSTLIPSAGTRVLIPFDSVVLEPGSSFSIQITPPTGNTSMDVQVGVNLHREVGR